jgi:hypothetical protein
VGFQVHRRQFPNLSRIVYARFESPGLFLRTHLEPGLAICTLPTFPGAAVADGTACKYFSQLPDDCVGAELRKYDNLRNYRLAVGAPLVRTTNFKPGVACDPGRRLTRPQMNRNGTVVADVKGWSCL